MEPIKDPPKGFKDWWHRNGFDGKNYIFYRSARSTEGYCTSCIGRVKLPGKPKHNAEGRCPVCRKKVMYISRAKKTQCLCTGEYEVSCIQRYKEGLVQRDLRCTDMTTRMTGLSTDLIMVSVSIVGPLLQKRGGGHTSTRITAGGECAGHWTGMHGLENTAKPCIGKL